MPTPPVPGPYYHSLIRKYVVLFGSLFNSIYIDRVNETDVTEKVLKVPLSYGPKEWYLSKLYENGDLTREISNIVPRMTFDIVGFRYAAERKLNTTNQSTSGSSATGTLSVVNQCVPYDILIRMSVLVRNADDGTRIIEQIIPRFTPELTTSLVLIPEMNIIQDIPIILGDVNYDDKYEGAMRDEDRVLVWNLTFLVKAYFYGPVARSKVIKHIDVSMFDRMLPEEVPDAVTITITPGLTANGDPTTDPDATIPYQEINKDDNWDFIVQFTSSQLGEISPVPLPVDPSLLIDGFFFDSSNNSGLVVLL